MNNLFGVVILSTWMLLLPFGMKVFLNKWKIKWGFPSGVKSLDRAGLVRMYRSAVGSYIFFEFLLIILLFSVFFSMGFALIAVWFHIGPYLFHVTPADVVMTQNLTVGVFLFLAFSFGFPWVIFHYVGVGSIRDVHQLCKEMRDVFLLIGSRLSQQALEESRSRKK